MGGSCRAAVRGGGCEQRGRLAAARLPQLRGVPQRVQAVESARECAPERATRERSRFQSASVCVCGHRHSRGACSRPRTNATVIVECLLASSDQRRNSQCECSRPMDQRNCVAGANGIIYMGAPENGALFKRLWDTLLRLLYTTALSVYGFIRGPDPAHVSVSCTCLLSQYRQSGLRRQQSLSQLSLTNLATFGSDATPAGFEPDFGSIPTRCPPGGRSCM